MMMEYAGVSSRSRSLYNFSSPSKLKPKFPSLFPPAGRQAQGGCSLIYSAKGISFEQKKKKWSYTNAFIILQLLKLDDFDLNTKHLPTNYTHTHTHTKYQF